MLNNLTECEEGDGGPNSQGEWTDPANSYWCVRVCVCVVCAEDEQMCLLPVTSDGTS